MSEIRTRPKSFKQMRDEMYLCIKYGEMSSERAREMSLDLLNTMSDAQVSEMYFRCVKEAQKV